jgi:tetratricopeptide (TPR) repeat protein
MTNGSQNIDPTVARVLRFAAAWFPPLAVWTRKRAQRCAGRALEAYLKPEPDLDAAAAGYREAIKWQHDDARLHGALGQVYYEQGNAVAAERQFRKALDYDYQNRQASKGLGVVLQERGELREAMYLYLRYLDLEPNDAAVCQNLGSVLYSLGNYEKAIEYYERAEHHDPHDVLIRKNHALALMALARYAESRATLEHAREAAPDDGEIDRMLGYVLEAQGDWDEAVKYFESAVQKDPDNADGHVGLSYISTERGRFQFGVEQAQIGAQLFLKAGNYFEAGRAYWQIGWSYYKLGDWDRSVQANLEALRLAPNLPPVYFNLGLTLLHLGRAEEARKRYEEGVAQLIQIADLKTHAIHDLRAALKENSNLAGGAEVLDYLESTYAAKSKELSKAG